MRPADSSIAFDMTGIDDFETGNREFPTQVENAVLKDSHKSAMRLQVIVLLGQQSPQRRRHNAVQLIDSTHAFYAAEVFGNTGTIAQTVSPPSPVRV